MRGTHTSWRDFEYTRLYVAPPWLPYQIATKRTYNLQDWEHRTILQWVQFEFGHVVAKPRTGRIT